MLKKVFKKKVKLEVFAPVEGKLISLEEVNDEVFSKKIVGDGIAVIPSNEEFKAPISGKLTKIFSTNHAYQIENEKGISVMVHIGLNTVELKGTGFIRVAKEGDEVKLGDVILKANLSILKMNNKDIATPILIISDNKIKSIEKMESITKDNPIMRVY